MATDQSGTHRRRPARARTLVEVDDVMFLIMPMILSRADVLALMHSRKSLYSVGISRLLTGFPVVISSPLKLASFCDFMLNFSSERKIFHFRQLSIALAKWSIREYHSTLRDFIRLLGNAVYLETIYFKDLDGWIGLNRDVQKMLLPLKQLTSLHLCEAGEKSFEIISHHSSTLRSLRLDQMGNVSAEIISKTLSKLSRNLHQFHISQLSGAHLEGLIFLRTESLILDTPQTLELLPLLRSFPKITSLTYYSPYVHREISEEEQFLVYSANRLSQSQMTFTHLRHLRGDPMGLFLLGLKGHVVYLDITSYEESNFAEFYAVFSQTQPSRLSMEMSIKNFRRTCSRLKRYLLNPSSPILTHLALTVKFNPSNKQTLPPVIKHLLDLVQQLSLQFISIRFLWNDLPQLQKRKISHPDPFKEHFTNFTMRTLAKELVDGSASLKFIFLEITGLGEGLWEVERVNETTKLVALVPDYSLQLMNKY